MDGGGGGKYESEQRSSLGMYYLGKCGYPQTAPSRGDTHTDNPSQTHGKNGCSRHCYCGILQCLQ